MAGELIFLKSEKLRKLAELVRGYEFKYIQELKFKSDVERVKYMRTCNSNMESAKSLLDECDGLVSKYENDSIRSPIASLVLLYTETCLNNALQVVRNYTLRRDYLDKVITHVDELIKALQDLDTGSAKDVASLTNQIQYYNNAVYKYAMMSVNSEASKAFSSQLRKSGIKFPALLQIHQAKFNFPGYFKDLSDEQKLQVYDDIIEASGRGKPLVPADEETSQTGTDDHLRGSYQLEKEVSIGDVAGKVQLMYNAASITWDIYTSEDPIKEAAKSAVVEAAKEGGAVLTEIVAAAAEAAAEDAEVSALVVTGIGMLVGFVGSFIIGTAVGALFDLIFSSGGTAPLPTDGLIFHVATMPSGQDLARIIA